MKRTIIATLCATLGFTIAPALFAQGAAQRGKLTPDAPDPKAKKISKGEAAAFNAMAQAQAPDDRIRLAEELITKYADTPFKSFALWVQADAYEQKNAHEKSIVYAEQAVEADPNNYDAKFIIANVIAAQTKETDLDMNDKLTRAEKEAKDGMAILATAVKPKLLPMSDAQWEQNKKFSESQAWQALGIAATVRKKSDDALSDYNKALALNPDPVLMIRAGRAMLTGKKYDEAIAWFDKAAADPGASAQIKGIATSDKARATAAKAQAK